VISLNYINQRLFYDVWQNNMIASETKGTLKDLIEEYTKIFYGRQRNKNIIHIGLDDPGTNIIGNQILMFGPAGNFPAKPEIIITGISTSITAANGIAMNLKELNIDNIQHGDLRSIYLKNIYKGQMYKNFKSTWEKASKDSTYKNSFRELFLMIEGKRETQQVFKIMVTQLTLHGIATYYNDTWHKRVSWSSPSTEVFNNDVAEELYNNFFVQKVLKERFLFNDSAKCLFVMGNEAYRRVKDTIDINDEIKNLKTVRFKELEDKFSIKDLISNESKFICKIKHARFINGIA